MEDLERVASVFVISNVAVSAACIGYWWYKGDSDYWKHKGIPYEPRRNVFKVYTDQNFKDDHLLEMERARKYGKIYGYFEHQPNLIICDAPVLQEVLNNHKAFSFRRVFDYPQPVFEHFIPTLNGLPWDRVRKTMVHAFTTANLKKMVPNIVSCADTLIKGLNICAETGTPADCKRFFGSFGMDVLASCAFSIRTNAIENPDDPFVVHAKNAFGKNAGLKTLVFYLLPAFMRYFLGVHFLDNEAVAFFKTKMMEELRNREQGEKKDFLDVMMSFYDKGLELQRNEEIKRLQEIRVQLVNRTLDTGALSRRDKGFKSSEVQKFLTYDEVIAQSVMFFVVGYETVVSLMCFLAYNLACHPNVQEKLIQEIDAACLAEGEMLTYDFVRDKMPYLRMVVNETLRIQPPTIKAERTAVQDYKLEGKDITIDKGTVVGYSIYAIHHDPDYYPDPDKFDPERFCDESKIAPCSFIPFGHGRRNCMGELLAVMEAKHCIIKILRTLRFKTCESTTVPMKYVKNQGLLSPKDCMLKVEPRSDVPSILDKPGPSGYSYKERDFILTLSDLSPEEYSETGPSDQSDSNENSGPSV